MRHQPDANDPFLICEVKEPSCQERSGQQQVEDEGLEMISFQQVEREGLEMIPKHEIRP